MILYSSNCSKCKILETILKSAQVEFTVSYDLTKVIDLGLREMPILEVDEGDFLGFNDAISYIAVGGN